MTRLGNLFPFILGRLLRWRELLRWVGHPRAERPEPDSRPPEGALRVMTFNLRGSYHRDGENAWNNRAALNVRTIARQGPDLIGFQEFQDGNEYFYDRELAGYEHVRGHRYENRPPHAYNAIYWDPGRLEMLDAGGFWLSETPGRFSGSWETRQIRSANWVRLRPVSGGPEFVHLNTHLDHVSDGARVEGSKLILDWLDGPEADGAPVLLTGDFNCEPSSKARGVFDRAGFVDAHLAAGHARAKTFHAFRGDAFKGRDPSKEHRIDWVLLRDGSRGERWALEGYSIVRDAEAPLYPSDHYPVVADLSLRGGASGPPDVTRI